MKVLVACEESQAVTIELRKLGHEAYSCDIIECSGGHPEWHIKQDVLQILNPGIQLEGLSHEYYGIKPFETMDGVKHFVPGKWNMIIAFPPCTYLTVTGNRWFNVERYGEKAIQRHKERAEAIKFFMAFANADCARIAIENPIGVMSRHFRKPDQIVHPYYFAESEDDENCERKSTCLWLKGLKPLEYEIKYKPRVVEYKNGKGTDSPWHMNTMGLPHEERAKMRSKTFPGIAKAMAEQWGGEAK
jgi:hypothetical protein